MSSDITFKPGITGAPKPPMAAGGLPLIGHAKPVLQDPNQFFMGQYLKHGPVFRVKFGPKPVNVFCGADMNKWCTRYEKDFLQSEGMWDGLGRVYGGDARAVIVNNDGPHHKALRSQLKDSMSKDTFAKHHELADHELNYAIANLPANQGLDVVALCKRVIYQQLGRILVDDAPWPYLDAYSSIVDAFILSVTVPLTSYLPRFGKSAAAIETVRKHSQELVKRNLDRNYLTMKPDNFIGLLIQGAQKGLYKESDLPFLSVGAIVAGIDTLAHSMAFAIYAIAADPDLKKVVEGEVDDVMTQDIPVMDKLKQINETRSAVMESMRLYPISPGQRRMIRNDVEINGYQLRAGEEVIVAHAAAHIQPDIYENPMQFDRSRFATGRTEFKRPGAFAPYGVGPHICLGAGMAEVQMLYNVAEIFRKYDVQADPTYRLAIQWIPSGKPKGFNVKLIERTAKHHGTISQRSEEVRDYATEDS